MNRARRENESFEEYRGNLQHEQRLLDHHLKGKLIWRGYSISHLSGRLVPGDGTAVRNPKGHREGQPPYVKQG